MNQTPKRSTGDLAGVYYRTTDYAGLGRRLLVALVDTVVLLCALFTLVLVRGSLAPEFARASQLYASAFVAFAFGYLALLGRSRYGTLGYALTRVRVVDLRGEQPSVLRMSFRTMLGILGPLDALANIIWLGGDVNRQSVHDKLAGTYIVRRGAEPEGRGLQRFVTYTLFGYNVTV